MSSSREPRRLPPPGALANSAGRGWGDEGAPPLRYMDGAQALPGPRAMAMPAPPPTLAREFSLADLGPVLRQIGRIVMRHWWLGLLLAVAELVAFGYYLSGRQPEYTAETTLLAQSALDHALGRDETSAADAERRENLLRNHQALMTSRRFRAVLASSLSPEEARAVQTPLLEPGQEATPEHLQSVLARSLEFERERGRELFVLRATHPDPDVAVMLADRFGSEYLDYARGELRSAHTQAQTALQAEAAAVERDVQRLEDRRGEYQQRFDAITGGGGRDVIAQRIQSLNTALSLVRVQRTQAEVQLRQAEADFAKDDLPLNNPTLAAYGNTAQLRADIDKREAERAMLATHYGPNHPKRQEADRALESLRDALRHNFSLALEELRARVHLAGSEEAELQRELGVLLKQAGEVERVAAELATLEDTIAARRATHGDLLRRIAEAGITAELPADLMRVVDHAFLRRPWLPPAVVLGAAGIGGALLLFILGPLLWHACNRRVTSSLDVESLLGIELLGVIPRLPWLWSAQRPHLVRRGRRPEVVEAFLATASRFELRSAHGCPRRIVISSTLPAEGKSIIASNLAAAFTRLGYRALLVDCDLRRPTQHRFHKCAPEAGLLAWIAAGCPGGADASYEAIGLQALPGGTWLLPAGGADPEPARHFLRPEVVGLFARLGREFDVTIIDTSPAGLFPDAYFVARFADAVALVVREGVASRDQVRKVLADFARAPTPVSGLIFNALAGTVVHPSFGYRTVAAKYARYYVGGARPLPAHARDGRPPVAAEPLAG